MCLASSAGGMTEDRLKWTALIQRVTVVGAGESAERHLIS